MVQRQIGEFFKKQSAQKYNQSSPQKSSQENYEKLSQDTLLFQSTDKKKNSDKKQIFTDLSSSKRTFSQMLQENSGEKSLLDYFTIESIKQSKTNLNPLYLNNDGEELFLDTQSTLSDIRKNKRHKLNEDSNTITQFLRQERVDESKIYRNEKYRFLPNDLMLNIFKFLDMKQLLYIQLVCRYWKLIALKVLKNYHVYFFEFSLDNLSVPEFNYLKMNSELTHIKLITKLFKVYQIQKIFETFQLYCKLSQDYNQSKPDKMFESIRIQTKNNSYKRVSSKAFQIMLEHSKNSLKQLCVRSIELPHQVSSYIPNLRELEELFLLNNLVIDDSIIQSICSRCKNLNTVQLSNCVGITDKSIECISSISNLQRLDLSSNNKLTLSNISKLKNNKYLISLSLRNTQLSTMILDDLLSNVQTLKRLNIDECKQLNFLSFQVLKGKLPKSIRVLSVDKTNIFNEQYIFEILDKNEKLIQIKTTSNCETQKVLQKLQLNRVNLILTMIDQGLKRSYMSAFNILKENNSYNQKYVDIFEIED